MKKSMAKSLIGILLMFSLNNQAQAGGKIEVCKYESPDIGTIVGKGKTAADAFEDAATQCFDRRARMYKASRKIDSIGEDPGILYIDICANISCSS